MQGQGVAFTNAPEIRKKSGPGLKRHFTLLLALILFSGAPLFAAQAILTRLTGKVEFRGKGKKNFLKARRGLQIKFGDSIRTLAGSKAQIVLANGSAVLIKESTLVKLAGKPGRILLEVEHGEFLIGVKKKLARGQTFRVKTPAAIAAVRGTLFWGLSDENQNSTYACLENSIQITAQGVAIFLQAGNKTFIPYGEAPQKQQASNILPSFIDTFEVDGNVEGLNDLLK